MVLLPTSDLLLMKMGIKLNLIFYPLHILSLLMLLPRSKKLKGKEQLVLFMMVNTGKKTTLVGV
ncbi:hypothetical protein Anas_12947 [Armadillidium nasatum]|uniref:Uncharacterized protein n=1 Tax=Armadillidium nasatum TaxID=96803 RepID=A0A5N5T8N7_9CRUS|nr:hypothetical protein Anas_12947 [Armadillidium nasatum]